MLIFIRIQKAGEKSMETSLRIKRRASEAAKNMVEFAEDSNLFIFHSFPFVHLFLHSIIFLYVIRFTYYLPWD